MAEDAAAALTADSVQIVIQKSDQGVGIIPFPFVKTPVITNFFCYSTLSLSIIPKDIMHAKKWSICYNYVNSFTYHSENYRSILLTAALCLGGIVPFHVQNSRRFAYFLPVFMLRSP